MVNSKKNSFNSGGLVISHEVISAIAMNAAKDVAGVVGFATRTPDIIESVMGLDSDSTRAVRVEKIESSIKLHINLVVAGDANIPTVCAAVQQSVKNAVQGMTGIVVGTVDVTVADVQFK